MKESPELDLFRRLLTRKEIAKHIQEGSQTPEEIRRAVRFWQTEKMEPVLQEIQKNEFLPDPRVARLMQELQMRLEKNFPHVQGLSLVLYGSALHPSNRVRQLMRGQYVPGDIDWGITYDFPFNKSDYQVVPDEITDAAERMLKKIRNHPDINLPEVEMCEDMSARYNFAPNFYTEEDAWSFLIHCIEEHNNMLAIADLVVLYFDPSVKPEVNERNKRLFFTALSKLSLEKPEAYEKAIFWLSDAWKQARRSKEKDFQNNFTTVYQLRGSSRDVEIVQRLIHLQERSSLFTDRFQKLLQSTDLRRKKS